jgi:hypothetical protein
MKKPIFVIHPDAVARSRMLANALRHSPTTAKTAEPVRTIASPQAAEPRNRRGPSDLEPS